MIQAQDHKAQGQLSEVNEALVAALRLRRRDKSSSDEVNFLYPDCQEGVERSTEIAPTLRVNFWTDSYPGKDVVVRQTKTLDDDYWTEDLNHRKPSSPSSSATTMSFRMSDS